MEIALVKKVDRYLCQICSQDYIQEHDAELCESKPVKGEMREYGSKATYSHYYGKYACIIRGHDVEPKSHVLRFTAIPMYSEQAKDLGIIKGNYNSFSDIEEGSITKVYNGWILKNASHGEADCLALLGSKPVKNQYGYYNSDYVDEPLFDILVEDMRMAGKFLSIRYWISDRPLTENERITEMAMLQSGFGHAEYCEHYSDLTGYLWTDEDFNVGGHDMHAELESYDGKYLHMEIKYDILKPE